MNLSCPKTYQWCAQSLLSPDQWIFQAFCIWILNHTLRSHIYSPSLGTDSTGPLSGPSTPLSVCRSYPLTLWLSPSRSSPLQGITRWLLGWQHISPLSLWAWSWAPQSDPPIPLCYFENQWASQAANSQHRVQMDLSHWAVSLSCWRSWLPLRFMEPSPLQFWRCVPGCQRWKSSARC